MSSMNRILLFLFLALVSLLTACGGGGDSSDGDSSGGNETPSPASFDGNWYGPCLNNQHGFSARQKIAISGNVLTSDISTYANAPANTHGCSANVSPISTEVLANLTFGDDANEAGCKNSKGINTTIKLIRVQTSGNDEKCTT